VTAGWDYELSPEAQRDARRLDSATRRRIFEALDRLVDDPPQGDRRKLRGTADEWRLRVGGWRIRFRLRSETETVVILTIRPRDRAYR
jgi:mRNA interferase RelE/StbE